MPLDLPGHSPRPSYDDRARSARPTASRASYRPRDRRRPSRARRPREVDDDEELAKQLATLSPRAANAIRAAAEATTDEERDAALDEVDGDDEPLNRGLLLKFLSSVKS